MSNTQDGQQEESSLLNGRQAESQVSSPESTRGIPKIFSSISAFSRYQPLTNLQRGNVFHDKGVETQIERSIFTLAAQGEISIDETTQDIPVRFPEEPRDENERTLIHIAAAHGQLVTLKSLLARSNNIKSRLHKLKDLDGATPLHYAAHGGHASVVKELLSAADPSTLHELINAATDEGCTALMYACYFKHIQVVRELVNSKLADLSTKNNVGLTAYSLAVKSDCQEIISILDSHVLRLFNCNSSSY